ncbi:MAG: TetR/AcrR family transcriptional regulator [Nitriliruptorales bacterium]|nr:TetR/AcrR family transcriptional regulator [Nitriliruptorales bacterium]
MTAVRTRAARGEGDRLRDEVLEAAEQLLVEAGSTLGVSMRQIADCVGVTAPALYLHFDDKDELFFEVCMRRFGEFHEYLLAAVDGLDDPAERLAALGRAYVEYGLRHPRQYEVLFVDKKELAFEGRDDIEELPGYRAMQLLVDTITDGIERGVFRRVDPWVCAVDLWAQTHGLVLTITTLNEGDTPFPPVDEQQVIDLSMERTLHGLLT